MDFDTLLVSLILLLVILLLLFLRITFRKSNFIEEELQQKTVSHSAQLAAYSAAKDQNQGYYLAQIRTLALELLVLGLLYLFLGRMFINLIVGPRDLTLQQLSTLPDPPGTFLNYYRFSGDEVLDSGVVTERVCGEENSSICYDHYYLLRQGSHYLVIENDQAPRLPLACFLEKGGSNPAQLNDVLGRFENVLPYRLACDYSIPVIFVFTILSASTLLFFIHLTIYGLTHSPQKYTEYQASLRRLVSRFFG
jgi:hypothetical protein